jgi:hypothetical protein
MNEGLKYLIKNEIEEEEFKLYIEYLKLIKQYEKNICSKCIGTKQQKKRCCGILDGFSDLGCNYMTKAITKKMKEKNKLLIKKVIAFQVLSNAGKVA